MSREMGKPPGPGDREAARLAVALGLAVRAERRLQRLTLRAVEHRSGVSKTRIGDVEAGAPASLETYVRIARALRLRPDFALVDPRRRPTALRSEDPVHAAMGEAEASHLRALGFEVGLDEPFQHFQFAGRADLFAWSLERRSLLHVENKTALPNVQEAFGSFNAKRAYLGGELAARTGVGRWASESHVLAVLWSAECLHTIRLRRASFAAVCPDAPETFAAWWRGEPPRAGRTATLVALDPAEGRRRDRRRWAAIGAPGELERLRPRYRDYRDAARALVVTR